MARPRHIILDGKAYLWSDILQLRRDQLQAAARDRQLALFEMRDDCRPEAERNAAGRYLEPSLFTLLN